MGPISGLITADFSTTTAATADKKPSVARAAVSALRNLVDSARKTASERHLRAELASMDDSLLKDIGVADDEIYLIRAGQVFTPRAWMRNSGMRHPGTQA